MSRVLVLGGSGEMGSAAVADLVARTDHEVTIGDIRPDAAAALLRELGAPERVVRVDVDDPASLAAALAGTETVLNATYMRQVVAVTDAAIAAGVHLVDLGAYYPETREQLARHDAALAAGCRIVPGCGVAPGLTNILARLGADRLDRVDAIRMYSYITHPMWTSPGIVVTRFDASTGTSLVLEDGALVERPRSAARSASPSRSRTASRRSTSSPTPSRSPCRAPSTSRTSCSRSATRPTRRAASGSCSSWASIARRHSRSTAFRSRRGGSRRRTSAAAGSAR